MIIPSTRLFTAGEIETGSFLNSSITNLGNFLLGKPVAKLYSTTATAVAALTVVPVPLALEIVDRDNGHSTTTNTSRYTAQTAGYYQIDSGLGWNSTAGTYRICYLRVNGSTTVIGSLAEVTGTGTNALTTKSSVMTYLAVGDYVEIIAYSGTATTLTSILSDATAYMNVVWVSV
jgi:hypothetical protein